MALGFALWQVAAGFSSLIETLAGGFKPFDGWATWDIGGHTFTFDLLFRGVIELVVVGLISLLVLRRRQASPDASV